MTHTNAPSDANVRLLTVAEAAERLGCSKPHIYRLIAANALKAVDISAPGSTRSKSRIRVDDLAKYINSAASQ